MQAQRARREATEQPRRVERGERRELDDLLSPALQRRGHGLARSEQRAHAREGEQRAKQPEEGGLVQELRGAGNTLAMVVAGRISLSVAIL